MADYGWVLSQFHQLARSWFVCSLDEHGSDWVNAERSFVLLLTLDEMVVGAEFFEHVGLRHRAPVRFVAKVGKPDIFRTFRYSKAEQGVRLHGEALGFDVVFFPEVPASMPGTIRSRSLEARMTSTAATTAGALWRVSTSANFIGSCSAKRLRQ